MGSRRLSESEKSLIRALIRQCDKLQLPETRLDDVKVIEMSDGGMGSLRFLPDLPGRRMGQRFAELRFTDADGVDVVASLNLDEAGLPFELDIWKTNFAPLIRVPDDIV